MITIVRFVTTGTREKLVGGFLSSPFVKGKLGTVSLGNPANGKNLLGGNSQSQRQIGFRFDRNVGVLDPNKYGDDVTRVRIEIQINKDAENNQIKNWGKEKGDLHGDPIAYIDIPLDEEGNSVINFKELNEEELLDLVVVEKKVKK